MKIVRSFPKTVPPGRAYVQDAAERFVMDNYDYSGLAEFAAGEDVLLLEWDIAVSRHDLSMFTARAHLAGDWPLVAPYTLDRPGSYPFWRFLDDGTTLRRIRDGEPDCDLFGLGLVYLPNWVIAGFPKGVHMSDGTLSRWLREQPEWRPIPIDWATRIVHLH